MDNQNNFNQQDPQNQYQQNPYQQNNYNEQTEVMSLGQWVLTLIICAIPCVNIIMLLVWSFGSGTNANKKNFSRAQLIILLVQAVLATLMFSALGAWFMTLMDTYYYY